MSTAIPTPVRRATLAILSLAIVLLTLLSHPLTAAARSASFEPDTPTAPSNELPTEKDPEGRVRRVDAKEAELADAEIIAKTADWSVAATIEHMRTQDRFGNLLAEMTKRFPRQLAAGVFADRPGAPSVVRFVGAVPDAAREMVKTADVRVELRGGASRSQEAARELSRKVHQVLAEQGFEEIVTAATPEGTVEATVRVIDGEKPELPKELADEVELVVASERIADDFHTRGGALVTGAGSCTSGFAVQSFAGTTGVTTAGHCTGINTYSDPSGVAAPYGLTHQGEHRGRWGDVEWKTSSHVEPAEYYARANELRDVDSVEPYGALATNNWYCFYGRFSNNRQCDQVYRTSVSATVSGVWNDHLVAMDDNNAIPGDSGGPWSWANEATGSTKGYVTIWFQRRDVFSFADLYPVALGVFVRT